MKTLRYCKPLLITTTKYGNESEERTKIKLGRIPLNERNFTTVYTHIDFIYSVGLCRRFLETNKERAFGIEER